MENNKDSDRDEAGELENVEAIENIEPIKNVEVSETLKLSMKAKNALRADILKRSAFQKDDPSEILPTEICKNLKVTIEDYGSEKPLPHYGLNRPNADYFNSSIHLRNMNIMDPSGGTSSIFLYDERSGGKDGNSVCSVRWENLRLQHEKHSLDKSKPARNHVGIYDNCTGQNKSNTVFKFEVLQTVLGFYDTKNKLFLLPGHSHNSSDVKTAELNSCLKKKNLYTAKQVCKELQALKNSEAFILEKEHFFEWEAFLDKYIKNMPPGFTSFYCFEISGGSVVMKRLCTEVTGEEIETKVLVENVEATKIAILAELFGLTANATLEEIITTPPRLPRFQVKQISVKRLASIKKKYEVIPKEDLWYYPDGDEYLLARANTDGDKSVIDGDLLQKVLPALEKPKKKAGRPKAAIKVPSKTPSILNFFRAFPVISKTSSIQSQPSSGSNGQPDVSHLMAGGGGLPRGDVVGEGDGGGGGGGDVGVNGNIGHMQEYQRDAGTAVSQLIDDENDVSDEEFDTEQLMINSAQESGVRDAFDDIYDKILEK